MAKSNQTKGWLNKYDVPQAQEGTEIDNLTQEGIDFIQSIYRNNGPATMLGRLPFNIGAAIGVVQSRANNQPVNLSDEIGLIPNTYAQAASYVMLMAEKEKENLQKFGDNRYRGKDLTELVPTKEVNNTEIDNTFVPKPKIGKLKTIEQSKKVKEKEIKQIPYKKSNPYNNTEIDNTYTSKPRINDNVKIKPTPSSVLGTPLNKFTAPSNIINTDSFVMPKEFNNTEIDNTRTIKPKNFLKKENGGWMENYNDSNAFASPDMVGDGFSNVGRNSSPAWGGQFEEGGEIPNAQRGKTITESTGVYKKPFNERELKNIIKDDVEYRRTGDIKNPRAEANKFEKYLPSKETVDFFKKLKKDVGPAAFKEALKIQHERGNPAVNVGTNKGLPFHNRRNYNPFTNEINIPKPLDDTSDLENYLTEVGHAGQPLSEVIPRFLKNDIPGYIKAYTTEGDSGDNIQQYVYDNPNTVENYTHAKIQPELQQRIDSAYSWPKSKEEEAEFIEYTKQSIDNPQYQMGGSIPGAVGFTYARTKGIPSEGKYAKKTLPSAQDGKDMHGNPMYAQENYVEGLERSNYDPRLNRMNLGKDYNTWADKDRLKAHENYHAIQHAQGRDNFDIAHNTENRQWAEMQKRPEIMSTDEVWNNFYNRKNIETNIDVNREVQNFPEAQFFPQAAGDIIANKIVDPAQYNNPSSLEGEAQYYENTGKEFQNGGEMKFYQEGLDFQPKTISKNGAWLDNYEKAQDGDLLSKWRETHPSVKSMRNDSMNRKIEKSKGKSKETNIIQKDNTKTVTPELLKKLTKQQAKLVQKDLYENPIKQEGITSGDKRVDFLYNNEWLMKVPILGDYIKDQAKEVAKNSGGTQTVDNIGKKAENTDYLQSNEAGYTGSIGPKGINLLDQYFSKEALLPKSKYKPNDDYLEFLPSYSIKGNFNQDRNKIKKLNKIINEEMFNNTSYEEFLKNKKPIYINNEEATEPIAGLLQADLGGHKSGIAWDKEKNLPYVSISDAWDFEPSHYSEKWAGDTVLKTKKDKAFIQSYLMHKAGNPFKIYDRFYFNPETKEYIPDLKQGGIIKDDRGQWDHPGEITEIGSNEITMEGVPYDVLGISDTGDTKLMKPGKDYKFKGKKVTEFPMAKNGLRQEQKGLVNLDDLTNFTNYNKPTKGWLNKYN
jgi:hypothetical protein